MKATIAALSREARFFFNDKGKRNTTNKPRIIDILMYFCFHILRSSSKN